MLLKLGWLLAFVAHANQMSVKVGGQYNEANVPYVSVTICTPGTKNCQAVDKIMLDTASTGLRVFSSLIHVPLTTQLDSKGATVAKCTPSLAVIHFGVRFNLRI